MEDENPCEFDHIYIDSFDFKGGGTGLLRIDVPLTVPQCLIRWALFLYEKCQDAEEFKEHMNFFHIVKVWKHEEEFHVGSDEDGDWTKFRCEIIYTCRRQYV